MTLTILFGLYVFIAGWAFSQEMTDSSGPASSKLDWLGGTVLCFATGWIVVPRDAFRRALL